MSRDVICFLKCVAFFLVCFFVWGRVGGFVPPFKNNKNCTHEFKCFVFENMYSALLSAGLLLFVYSFVVLCPSNIYGHIRKGIDL